MNFIVKVRAKHEQSMERLLKSLEETGVIEHFEIESDKKANFIKEKITDRTKDELALSTKAYIDQYRDLVD